MSAESSNEGATIFGLLSAAFWTAWGPAFEKILYALALALITGFAYRAGGWIWDRAVKRTKEGSK